MGKILLTSSQVSVLVSGAVIVLCTFALFFSGYVLQQRTLQQLRVAIKPRPSRQSASKVYLPDRFRATTTELEDGTIVFLESEAEQEARMQDQQRMTIEVKETESKAETHKQTIQDKIDIVEKLKAQIMGTKSAAVEQPESEVKKEKPVSSAERRRLIKEEIRRLAQADEPVYYQRRLW